MLYMIKKVALAIIDALRPAKSGSSPRLIMTLLVKNEEKMLEHNILFHKAMGIDAFIVTDNDSTDSTPEIIKKYVDKGWIVEAFHETTTGHLQKRWVDRMIWCAKTKHAADWIVNGDADELWYSPSGDLKAEMRGGCNILRCKSINVYPEEGVELRQRDKLIKPIEDTSKYNLSEFNIFKPYTYKVAHAARGYIRVSMGNHKVTMIPSKRRDSEIIIYHYNILDQTSFVDKVAKSGPRPHLKAKKKKGTSRHWRYFYELHTKGLLAQEYDRVVGKSYFKEFMDKGYIYVDRRAVEILDKIYSGTEIDK